jgi:peptidoglycan/xylan/chitin deacetylase (PgdA/CDA1 family)/LysM repeat protein
MFDDQVHRVAPGETLTGIAGLYGITLDTLLGYNQYITNPDLIFPGQVVIIPGRYRRYYTVRPGDTLTLISNKFGIPISMIANINGINDVNIINIGQALLIPEIYTVEQGDTLTSISEKLGVDLRDLQIENNLTGTNLLYTGQQLIIPFRSASHEELQNLERVLGPVARRFPGIFFFEGQPDGLRVALTFDDGPSKIGTNEVLDILKEHQTPATFFLLGTSIYGNSDVVKRIVSEGHTLGNHSATHVDLRTLTRDELKNELMIVENEVYDITGLRMALVRPPYGFLNDSVIEEIGDLGYKIIKWSVDTNDWRDLNADQVLINTIPNIRDGSIILMHDTLPKSATKQVLPEIILTLKSQGYTFVTVDELLGIDAYKTTS